MSQRIALIVNPTAGGGVGRVIGDQVRLLLRQAGHHIVEASGKTFADARGRGAQAVDEGVDLVVVVGGDGTAHLGVNLCAGGGPRLAVVAAGTGNDLARNLGLPIRDARAAVRAIETGTTRRVDAGRVTSTDGAQQWFAGVLGAGFDAVVTARAARMRWPRGQLRYALAMVRELPAFRPIPYVVQLDGIRHDLSAMLVAVANTTSFGGGMRVCPDADVADGLFDVLVVHALSIPDFVRVFPSVYSGRHVTHPAVQICRAARVRLEAEGIESQADGEAMARLPLEVENVPGALELVVGSVRAA
ncbi:MAG TPA: YegS/Rv2252/BmrU family lipid kinase [Intrasporangium sp.]|uniref:diacylglycerol/lipid kinase family protein n=1 Tax=Intrasporangium sp. TaxID=1925024 RepID=UPI002D78D572|nr:YegS/Rv2252/BmrU family lipid kinase [Intrasporangium sp.]HET7397116.1 YegS/Rv2252/BmrU family lipid kinase [Intrasporangium sp.]